MSYRDLPPGRERMLAYSNEVHTRFQRRYITREEAVASVLTEISTVRSPWRTSRELLFGTIPANRLNRLNNLQISPFYEYEVLSELPTVKIGLISKDLLNKSKINSSKSMSFCTICQQDIFLDIVRTLDCSHTYHVNCIDTWFTENKNCPQCRFEI
jgi:hypothetical protein